MRFISKYFITKSKKMNVKMGDKMTSVSGLDLVWMLIRRYMEIVEEEFGEKLLAMAVFGSLARGEAKFPGSDIDVLIVLKGVESLSFGKRINLMREAERLSLIHI